MRIETVKRDQLSKQAAKQQNMESLASSNKDQDINSPSDHLEKGLLETCKHGLGLLVPPKRLFSDLLVKDTHWIYEYNNISPQEIIVTICPHVASNSLSFTPFIFLLFFP